MTKLSECPGFSVGGGGGSSSSSLLTKVDTQTISLRASNTQPYYSFHPMPAAAVNPANLKSRNAFSSISLSWDSSVTETYVDADSWTVNRSTGAINLLARQNIFTNTNASSLSTLFMMYEPSHGIFSIHGYFPHTSAATGADWGYTTGRIDSSGTVDTTASMNQSAWQTQGDSAWNGTMCGCLPQGNTNNYLVSMYAGSGNPYSYRLIEANSTSGVTVNGYVAHSNPSSSTNSGVHHIFQPDQVGGYIAGDAISVGGIGRTTFNEIPGFFLYEGGGTNVVTNTTVTLDDDSPGYLFPLPDGSTVFAGTEVYGGRFSGMTGGSQPTYTEIDTGLASAFNQAYMNGVQVVGVGNGRFLNFSWHDDSSSNYKIFLFDFDPTTREPRTLAIYDAPTSPLIADPFELRSTYCNFFVVYENDTDTDPKWLVETVNTATQMRISTYSIDIALSTV